MGNDTHHTVAIFSDHDIADHLGELGALLHACVHHGASIGYVLPFSVEDGKTFWRDKVLPAVRNGSRLLLVVRRDGRIAGSVQLDYDTPPNQPHRLKPPCLPRPCLPRPR